MIATKFHGTIERMAALAEELPLLRMNELRCLRWCDVDSPRACLCIPADRAKTGRSMIFRLTEAGTRILLEQALVSDGRRYVFADPVASRDKPLPRSIVMRAFHRIGALEHIQAKRMEILTAAEPGYRATRKRALDAARRIIIRSVN